MVVTASCGIAEQRNLKRTPAFLGCFRCQKQKIGLWNSYHSHLKARFASFYVILTVYACILPQETRKTSLALVNSSSKNGQ